MKDYQPKTDIPVFRRGGSEDPFGKSWSREEENFLIEANEVMDRQEIADQLGRTLGSVNAHAEHLKLTGRKRIQPPEVGVYKQADFVQEKFNEESRRTRWKFVCPRCRRTLLAGWIRTKRAPKGSLQRQAEAMGRDDKLASRMTCKCGQTVKLWEEKT